MSLIDSLSGFGGNNLFGMGKSQGGAMKGMDMQAAIDAMAPQKVSAASEDASARLTGGLGAKTGAFANIPSSSGGDSFANTLGQFIDSVNDKAKAAEQSNTDIMTGKSNNIHQAMVSMQEASISFDLLVQVRNKLVESYKELSRISV